MSSKNHTNLMKGERPVLSQEFINQTHSVSWKKSTPGYASLEARIHTTAGWCSLVMREQVHGKPYTSKETYLTLDREQVESLKRLLAQIGTEPLKI